MKKQAIDNYLVFNDDKFTKKVIFKEDKSIVFVLNFKPGQSLPSHKHPGSNVQLLVLQGQGSFTIDGQAIAVQKNDAVFVEGDEELSFTNDSEENTSLYVILNRIPNETYAQEI